MVPLMEAKLVSQMEDHSVARSRAQCGFWTNLRRFLYDADRREYGEVGEKILRSASQLMSPFPESSRLLPFHTIGEYRW